MAKMTKITKIRNKWLELKYWIIIFAFLVVVGISGYLSIHTRYSDFGWNILAETIGIFLTIVLLIWMIERKENEKWKKVKDNVYRSLGIEIGEIFMDLSDLCEFDCSLMGINKDWLWNIDELFDKTFKQDFYAKLKELGERDEIKLNEVGREVVLEGGYGDLFVDRKDRLSEIESKYFRFLDPSIINSLIKIQNNLYKLDLIIQLKTRDSEFKNDDEFLKSASYIVHDILKEIGEFHYESGIDIPY